MAHNLISSIATIKAVKPGDARWRLDKLVSAGIDPSTARKQARSEAIQQRATERRAAAGLPPPDSFEAVARESHKKIAATWAPSHSIKIIRRLEQDVFPWIGSKPVGTIRPMELLTLLKRVALERLLHRLSLSPHRERFVLKGAMLP